MHQARETRTRSFPVIKMFNEVSNLLGTSGEAKRATGNIESEPLGIRSFSSLPSKLLISLNTFATGKDRTRDSRIVPGLSSCPTLDLSFRIYSITKYGNNERSSQEKTVIKPIPQHFGNNGK